MPSTARQLRQPLTIEAIGRVLYFADATARYTTSFYYYIDAKGTYRLLPSY